jgi:F-type H+-transporting ATPase subunit b
VLMFIVLMLGSLALAASGGDGGHHGGIPKMPMIWHAVNLGILLSLLTFLLRGPIRDALANRSASVKRDIDEANRLRKDAQHRMADLEQRLTGFEAELERMRTDAEADAVQEREVILTRAEADAVRIREGAERTIRDETDRARTALRREAAQLGISLARARLEAKIGPDDQARLTADFLSAVKSDGSEAHRG